MTGQTPVRRTHMKSSAAWIGMACLGLSGCLGTFTPSPSPLWGERASRPVHEMTCEQIAFDALQAEAGQGRVFTPAHLRDAIQRLLPASDNTGRKILSRALNKDAVFSHAAKSTLALYCTTAKDARSRTDAQVGTAFVIHSSGIAVTCLHALRYTEPFVMIGLRPDGQVVHVTEILSIFPRQDLVFIRLAGDGWDALPLRDASAGTRVFAFGHPLGIHFYMIEGLISRYENIAPNASSDEPKIRMNLSLASGSGFSGGPVLDARGNAVGMIDSMRQVQRESERYTVHSAIPAAVIRSCMAGHPPPAPMSDGEIRIALDPSKNEKTNINRKDVIRTQCPEGEVITTRTEKEVNVRVLDPDGHVLFSGAPSNAFRSSLPAWAQDAYDENMGAQGKMQEH